MTSVAETDAVRPGRTQGSQSSTKQIAWSVYKGQRVTCKTGDHSVIGYVFGQDDYHWLVVSSSLETHLVHKSCAIVTIHLARTYTEEKNYDALEELVGPFRRWVSDNVLKRPEPMSASIQRAG